MVFHLLFDGFFKVLLCNVDPFLLMVSLVQHTHDQVEGCVWLACYFHFYTAPKSKNNIKKY